MPAIKNSDRVVRLADVAAELGLSHSTVSRALAGHRRISAATRDKVAEAAERLGYRPDARLGELMAQVRAGKGSGYQGHLGAVCLAGRRADFSKGSAIRRFLQGIEMRADARGYGVSEFWMEEDKLDGRALCSLLRARGISGVMMLAPRQGAIPHDLEWDAFAWVTIGFRFSQPPLHAVTPDWFADAQTAVDHLAAAGHRRIGFVHDSDIDPLLGDNWLGGYLSQMFERRLAPMVFRAKNSALDGLVEWCAKRKPEALVVHSEYPGTLLARVRKSPKIFYLNLNRPRADGNALVTSCVEVGINAVDLLIGQLHRGDRGIPPFQKILCTQSKRLDPDARGQRPPATSAHAR